MCNDYRAVEDVSVRVLSNENGWYTVRCDHRHHGAEKQAPFDLYPRLTWEEALELIEVVLDTNRPGYRHSALYPEQTTLTF